MGREREREKRENEIERERERERKREIRYVTQQRLPMKEKLGAR